MEDGYTQGQQHKLGAASCGLFNERGGPLKVVLSLTQSARHLDGGNS